MKKVDWAILAQFVHPMHVTSSTYTICARMVSPSSSFSTVRWLSTSFLSISSSSYVIIPNPPSIPDVALRNSANSSPASSSSSSWDVATSSVPPICSGVNPSSCISRARSARSASASMKFTSSRAMAARASNQFSESSVSSSSPPSDGGSRERSSDAPSAAPSSSYSFCVQSEDVPVHESDGPSEPSGPPPSVSPQPSDPLSGEKSSFSESSPPEVEASRHAPCFRRNTGPSPSLSQYFE
mmetsp:Transcript_4948/g.7252  ORF Transcript_4948/g.7252 Transcript_4948/m.7252 type:complete len:240 (-) Transcript_4948:306-1025(-)